MTHNKENISPVVFIHGDLQNHSIFSKISKFFSARGHKILFIDLPGHGNSKFSLDKSDILKEIGKIIKKNNIIEPIIWGHSTGGIISAKYAAETKNVSSLILTSTIFENINKIIIDIDVEKIYKRYIALSESKFKKQVFIDYSTFKDITEDNIFQIGLETTNPMAFKNNLNFLLDLTEIKDIYSLNIPILYIISDSDNFIPRHYAKKCAGMMKNKKLFLIEGGHNFIITQPNKILEIIKKNYYFLLGQKV